MLDLHAVPLGCQLSRSRENWQLRFDCLTLDNRKSARLRGIIKLPKDFSTLWEKQCEDHMQTRKSLSFSHGELRHVNVAHFSMHVGWGSPRNRFVPFGQRSVSEGVVPVS
ncbi:hypothetical protein CDAR_8561 [Caerostris darwini]|uniref:Uncharacterized protein n=1 Tax=Caerostris darwini TaxID=1538125 RepID=A0AAV4R5N3_9ARAC|nr:hypothetical protein CDAR_8561 [Caerostris darwini]